MIIAKIPNSYTSERHYIVSVLFTEFLGLDTRIDVDNRADILILLNNNCTLIISDALFATPSEDWLKPTSLPEQPLKTWDLTTVKLNPTTVTPQIPVIYGNDPENPSFCQISEHTIYLGLDIFGSAFFMLTRYEEVVKQERDKHSRFPAYASLAYQEEFWYRPIVNEYVEILWSCLVLLQPTLERKPHHCELYLTHDVDYPYEYAFLSNFKIVKQIAAELFKRHNIQETFYHLISSVKVKLINYKLDPANTFDWLMVQSEENGLKSIFYFIPENLSQWDSNYSLDHPLIIQLLKNIHQRGHIIGYHGSYDSWNRPELMRHQISRLKTVMLQAGIEQETIPTRQHYLRWLPQTWQYLADAGVTDDSTVGFVEIPGFRCGTGNSFTVFNILQRCHLSLSENPLIIMDANFGSPYADEEQQNRWQEYTNLILKSGKMTNLVVNFHNNHINHNSFSKLNFKGLLKYILQNHGKFSRNS